MEDGIKALLNFAPGALDTLEDAMQRVSLLKVE